MSRLLLIDPFSGASGDMLLAALVDAGAPLEALREQVLSIPALSKLSVDVEDVRRGAFAARRLRVDMPHEHAHRGLSDVLAIVDGAAEISDAVRERARETFTRLAEVEARMHGTTVDEVHFHEVGALDAILDVVGFYVLAEALGVTGFAYTNIVLGGGRAKSAHGEIPVPSPATLELLAGHPVQFSGRGEELVTPTAAAIISAVFKPVGKDASFVGHHYGYGAGSRENAEGLPNVLRVVVGETAPASHQLAVIRCTIDDMNPELYGHVMQSLFDAGALEVYTSPVQMKKNRPGTELTVICEYHISDAVADRLMLETTTLGVRLALEERLELARRADTVETPLGTARVKIATLPGGGERMSPEYESCRELAAASGRPLLEVFDIVRTYWHKVR
jgi:uncharacterized protein (TIGR00299 family) protein